MAQVIYQPLKGDDLAVAETKALVTNLAAWVVVNPTAVIQPNRDVLGEGALPPFIRRAEGKRASIIRSANTTIPVAKFLTYAKTLGGGYIDLIAMLYGGFSRSSTTWGTAYISVAVPKANK
mgnify:CR=1 FL=1